MTEWSNAITFSVAMLILCVAVGAGIAFVNLSYQAGIQVETSVDNKINSTDNNIWVYDKITQDGITARTTAKTILCRFPLHINGNYYYNLYSGKNNVNATTLNSDLSNLKANKAYEFTVKQDNKLGYIVEVQVKG